MARDSREKEASGYESYYDVYEAEGWRICLAVCKSCGAVVLMGGESPERHDKWHRERERERDAE